MPNYALLQSKIQADHAANTPEQIRDALNTKAIAKKMPIATRDIKQYLILTGLWLGIKDSTSAAARIAVDALHNFDQFDTGNPLVEAKLTEILDALVVETQIPDFTVTHKAQILAMGQALRSWADQNWDGEVQLWQINEVLA